MITKNQTTLSTQALYDLYYALPTSKTTKGHSIPHNGTQANIVTELVLEKAIVRKQVSQITQDLLTRIIAG